MLSLGASIAAKRSALAAASAASAAVARKRAADRRAKAANARSIYAGARLGRLQGEWVMGPLSADLAIRGDLRALRDRARQLVRDNPLAKRYMRLAIENIVGADGVSVEPRVLRQDGKTLDEETNAYLKAKWLDWCEHPAVDGRSWNEVEKLAVGVWKSEGEFLSTFILTRANPFGFALQLLDNDQLDHELFATATANGNQIRMGVEVDQFLAPVAYHLWTAHPSEALRIRERIRVPADQVIHLADFERPIQTRGVTPFAPVMSDLNQRAGMQEAMLILQRTAACKMGFIVAKDGVQPPMDADEESETEGQIRPDGRIHWDAEPASIEQLPEGYGFESWDPGTPSSEYDPFIRGVDRNIAAGLNIAYASFGDLSQANYGSQRGGLLSERDGWMRDQQTLITRFHRRVYRRWLAAGILSGAIDLPYDLERYGRVHFQPRGFPWIDPAKDIDLTLREVNAGLDSLTDVAARKGRDLKKILETRKREIDLAQEMGVPINLLTQGKGTDVQDSAAPGTTTDDTDSSTGAPNGAHRPKLAAS